ncbi:MAG: hypothetical protein ACOYIL_06205, partial [Brevibacillus sp.]
AEHAVAEHAVAEHAVAEHAVAEYAIAQHTEETTVCSAQRALQAAERQPQYAAPAQFRMAQA